MKIVNLNIKSIIIINMIMMLFACKNKMSEIEALTPTDSLPEEAAKELILEYTEFGKLKFKLLASEMITYSNATDQLMEFPKGVLIYFYGEDNDIESEISSQYAIDNTTQKIITLRKNVIMINYTKKEKIETEELFWNQIEKKIWSDKFVKVITSDKQIEGYGFETNEDIFPYKILNPTGIFAVNEDENFNQP